MDEADGSLPFCCPECGAVMTSNRLDGICPVCLLDETDATATGKPKKHEEPTGPELLKLRGYRIVREIARGGMGIIYEAEQAEPQRRVAVKMLLPHLLEDPGMRERFRTEVQAMAGLDHSGILPVYEVGDYNGLPFFTMKLAPGGNLAKNAERFAGDWRAIAALTAHLADAIQTAHEYGLLHRDLKPANILFDEKDRASVSDFGIAKRLDDSEGNHSLTKSESLIGTPNYLPPEWASGAAKRPTTAGDIYGLGAILYELLTGRPPHQDKHLTALLRQIADEPVKAPRTVNPKIPRDLETICLKAIRKEPAQRYASASALAADLRNWLGGRPVQARSVTQVEKAWRWALRNPLPSTLALLLGLALTVGGAALGQSLRASRQHLHDALLAQAAALRENASLENQDEVLNALHQAAAIDPSPGVREEYISALSMTSLEEVRGISYGDQEVTSRVYTDAGLTCYTHRNEDDGLTIRRMDNSEIISSVTASGLDPDNYGPVSPDGKYLIVRPVKPPKNSNSVAQDTPLYVWDIQDGSWREKDLVGFYGCFSPDGRTMAISSVDGTVSFLNLDNGDRWGPFTTGFALQPRPYAFSPDGRKVLIGQVGNVPKEQSQQTMFVVMDVATGGEILRDKNPSGAPMRCVAWRYDSQSFFVGSENFRIYEWQMTPGSLPRQYVGHQGSITVLEVNRNGDMLISQAADKTTRLWNTGSGQPMATLSCTGSEAHFSPAGDRFICEDRAMRQLREFRLARSGICREFPIFHPLEGGTSSIGCYTLLFSPDGGLLTVGDLAGLLHFDGFTGASLGRSRLDPCWSVQWKPDGSLLYSSSRSGLHLRHILQTAGGISKLQPVQDAEAWVGPGNERTLNHCSLRPDGQALLMGRRHWLEVYDTATGRVKSRMGPIGDPPTANKPSRGGIDVSRINQNGTLAALSQEDYCDILIWDLNAGRQVGKIATQFPEGAVLFGRDPHTLYIGTQDEVACWDVRTLQNRWTLAVHPKLPMPAQLAFSEDFSVLAVTLTPDSVSLLNPETKEEIIRLRHATPHPISSLALSPDGTRLAVFCLGHIVQLWDLAHLRTLLAERKLDWSGPRPKVAPPRRWRILSEPEPEPQPEMEAPPEVESKPETEADLDPEAKPEPE